MKKIVGAVCGGLMLVTTLGACGGSDEFCGKAEEIMGSDASAMADPSSAGKWQELADEAPDEIKGDFQAVADALKDPMNADQQALMEAPQNIQKWGDENC